jgi:hypothetical protein
MLQRELTAVWRAVVVMAACYEGRARGRQADERLPLCRTFLGTVGIRHVCAALPR